jgi:hypothetical protein
LNTWRCPDYANDIDEELLVSKEYGSALMRTKFDKELPPRDGIQEWDDKFQGELDAGLKIGEHCPPAVKERVIALVKK